MSWLFSHVVECSTLFKEHASLFRLASSVLLMGKLYRNDKLMTIAK
nr:MAG TPA: hypothetical protein [Caudoviricetes sp.]